MVCCIVILLKSSFEHQTFTKHLLKQAKLNIKCWIHAYKYCWFCVWLCAACYYKSFIIAKSYNQSQLHLKKNLIQWIMDSSMGSHSASAWNFSTMERNQQPLLLPFVHSSINASLLPSLFFHTPVHLFIWLAIHPSISPTVHPHTCSMMFMLELKGGCPVAMTNMYNRSSFP